MNICLSLLPQAQVRVTRMDDDMARGVMQLYAEGE